MIKDAPKPLISRHFPIARLSDDGSRQWLNPILKVRAADRPEERVRLRMVEFLAREAGFSFNRMTTESAVVSQLTDHPTRADIICFDSFLRPLLLVECKAESVKLDEKAAIQAARYNLRVKAPYILLTNGIQDTLFAIRESGKAEYIERFESVFPLETEPPRALDYWQERGLWLPSDQNNELIEQFLSWFWLAGSAPIQYIRMNVPKELAVAAQMPASISFFGRIQREDSGARTAMGFFQLPEDSGRVVGVCVTARTDKSQEWHLIEPDVNLSAKVTSWPSTGAQELKLETHADSNEPVMSILSKLRNP
ncbi:MAG: type I restriction enzyme HsdR N-terminal domain-containing protein [Balneolales bacterium]|nr:type I restriction enzyme HsdR N-terminal domain-containing protein [Balneolales bacterium]